MPKDSFLSAFDGYTEDDVFEALDMAYVYPEYRESETAFDQSVNHEIPALITDKDIKGVVHNHSTYSDGIHSVSQLHTHSSTIAHY